MSVIKINNHLDKINGTFSLAIPLGNSFQLSGEIPAVLGHIIVELS